MKVAFPASGKCAAVCGIIRVCESLAIVSEEGTTMGPERTGRGYREELIF